MAGVISAVDFTTAVIFTSDTRTAFAERMESDALFNNRRCHVTPNEKSDMISWLMESDRKCESNQDYHRRHWVRTNFRYDSVKDRLLWTRRQHPRKVITVNKIPSVVEREHRASHIRGHDDTWIKLSKKCYGFTQRDVQYLLRRCEVCRGRPKGYAYIEGRVRRC
jgi:hypothetical protein